MKSHPILPARWIALVTPPPIYNGRCGACLHRRMLFTLAGAVGAGARSLKNVRLVCAAIDLLEMEATSPRVNHVKSEGPAFLELERHSQIGIYWGQKGP
jgi:hypothetical protein